MKKNSIYLKIFLPLIFIGVLLYYPYKIKQSSEADMDWIKIDLLAYPNYYDINYSAPDYADDLYNFLIQNSDVEITNYLFKKASRTEKLLVYRKGFINIKVGELIYYGDNNTDFRCSFDFMLQNRAFYSKSFSSIDFNSNELEPFFDDKHPEYQLFNSYKNDLALIKYSKNKTEVSCSKDIDEAELENLCKDLTLFIEQNNFDFDYALIPIQRRE